MSDYFPVTFEPAQRCCWCPTTAEELRWECESVARFILGHHGGQGTASVLARVPAEDVPGWVASSHAEFGCYAWSVLYAAGGKRTYGYALFNADEWLFS